MNDMTENQDIESQNEGYLQLTNNDTGWSEEERKVMREYGYDGMDILRVWLS